MYEWFPIKTPISQIMDLIYSVGPIRPRDPLLKVFYLTSARPPYTRNMVQLQPTETLEDALKKKDPTDPVVKDSQPYIITLMASVSR
jgi:hypothetical protein